jgi:hypothetical protein
MLAYGTRMRIYGCVLAYQTDISLLFLRFRFRLLFLKIKGLRLGVKRLNLRHSG